MNRDETVALLQKCEEARASALAQGASEQSAQKLAADIWNSWAQLLLERQSKLKDRGLWRASVEADSTSYMERQAGLNEETQKWISDAFVDFSKLMFLPSAYEVDLNQLIVEKDRRIISQEQWSSTLNFENVTVANRDLSFRGYIFPGSCDFFGSFFLAPVDFSNSQFADTAGFRRTHFIDRALFERAEFRGHAWFARTRFSEQAHFDLAKFRGLARFAGAIFEDIATFPESEFNEAWFRSVTFTGRAEFNGCVFFDQGDFIACRSDFAFLLQHVRFARNPPNFTQADFKQAPDLDDVEFPLPGFWRGGDAKLVPKYRALRRMAIQGADYEREQMAYKGELRARRWTVDKWWSIGTWIGLFYDAFADCGRSIVRPANAWLASILLFAAFYWQRAAAGVEARCEEAGGAAVQALFLSVKNALVIFGGTRDARVNQAYLCLYNGSAEQPRIPPTVTFVETLAQIPVSATLIFLFLLAVKNRFKIK